jgi:hypothetical protein
VRRSQHRARTWDSGFEDGRSSFLAHVTFLSPVFRSNCTVHVWDCGWSWKHANGRAVVKFIPQTSIVFNRWSLSYASNATFGTSTSILPKNVGVRNQHRTKSCDCKALSCCDCKALPWISSWNWTDKYRYSLRENQNLRIRRVTPITLNKYSPNRVHGSRPWVMHSPSN